VDTLSAVIVVPEEGRLRIITQHDHAHLAAQILSLWRADGLPDHPRRADLLLAVREHDNGWREADSAPRADPETGRPLDFRTVPREVRIELWRRGTARLAADRPWPALLITHHALALHRELRSEEPWEEELFAPLDELYEELLERAGSSPGRAREEAAADYRFLGLADALSLAACAGWTEPGEQGGYRWRYRPGGREVAGELAVEPFPLAGATTFRVPCRSIPDRPFRGDADLGGELAAARWTETRIRVVPASHSRL
jgi:hypothetical protein